MSKKQIKKFNDTKPEQRDYFLDFLKMICIIFVIIHHIFYYLNWYKDGMYDPQNFGFQYYVYQAVPIFMVISGYVWAKSYEKYGCKTLGQGYKPYILLKRFVRLFVPYVVYFFCCFAVACSFHTRYYDQSWIKLFFLGGPGPEATSSYYVVLLFSMLVLMPLIWFCVKKLNIWGVVIVYGVNILFEVIRWAAGMDSLAYQFILLRYVGLLAYGCYLFYNKDKKPIIWLTVLLFAIGVTFLSLFYYLPNYEWKFFNIGWEWSNIATFPYTIAIMAILGRYCHMKHKAWGFIGSKTWSIFLVQTFIFAFTLWDQRSIESPFIFSSDLTQQCFITLGLIIGGSAVFYVLIEWLATGNIIKAMDKSHHNWELQRKREIKRSSK